MEVRRGRSPYFMSACATGLALIIGLQAGCDLQQTTGESAAITKAMRVLPGFLIDVNFSIEVARDESEEFVIVTPAE